jgi:hypothetical protein
MIVDKYVGLGLNFQVKNSLSNYMKKTTLDNKEKTIFILKF